MKGRISVFSVSLILVALATLGACVPDDSPTGTGVSSGGGMISCDGGSPTSDKGNWANVHDVVDMTCFGSDCHTQGDRKPTLLALQSAPLSDTALYDTLTSYKTTKCGQRALVKPCAPDESAFYLAMAGMCGDMPQMPFGCLPANDNCTPADKLEGIRQWILSGAPRP